MYELTLINGNIFTPNKIIEKGFLSLKNNQIAYIGTEEEYSNYNKKNTRRTINLKGKNLVPGFFDIHTHGGAGLLYDEIKNMKELEKIAQLSAEEGVTTFIPTLLMANEVETLDNFIERAKTISSLFEKSMEGATPLGLNLELFQMPGKGAHAPKTIPLPNTKNWQKIKKIGVDKIKLVTIAPEFGEALKLIPIMKMDGVIPSIGHTDAEFEEIDKAIRRGACLITHLLNTCQPPTQDKIGVAIPGINEYLMSRSDIMAELIIDQTGAHIHPVMLNLAIKCLGTDNIIAISDAMHTRGTNIKEYKLGGELHYCDGNVNRKKNNEHLAGTANGMDIVISSMIKHTGISVKKAVKTATVNPAKLFNVYDKKGSIEVGKDADITVIDENINVFMTIVEGNIEFENNF